MPRQLSSQPSRSFLLCGFALCSAVFGATLASPQVIPHNYVVNALAALGDSYTTGPGAGGLLNSQGNQKCSTFDQSYPYLVFNDRRLKYNTTTHARSLYTPMCAGAGASDIAAQTDTMGAESDMVMLTVGANDIGLAGLLNSCVFRFYPGGGSCHQAQLRARNVIASAAFKQKLTTAINAIFTKAPRANVHVVGYPSFFNAATTQCSSTCFNLLNQPCTGNSLLSTAKRTNLNNIITSLNNVLHAAAQAAHGRATGSIQYVDTEQYFEGHRFCEDGITEPDYNNPTTYFFPFTYFTRPWLRQFDPSICGDYATLAQGEVGDMFACAVYEQNNTVALNHMRKYHSTQFPDPVTNSGLYSSPDYFTRIFHPNKFGTNAIHRAIMFRYRTVPA